MAAAPGSAPLGLRILTVTPLPPTVTGGIEEYAYGVADALAAMGNQVAVATSRIDNEAGPPAADVEIPIATLMILGRPLPWSPISLVHLLRAIRRADVVHLHMPYPGVEAAVALFARLCGVPLLVTYQMDAVILASTHEASKPGRAHLIERLYRTLSAQWPLRDAVLVVTSTAAYAQQSAMLPDYAAKVRIVHQGISAPRYRLATSERAAELRTVFADGRPARLVVFVGRLVPYKGVEYLIEAIPQVAVPDVVYVIGGTGPEEAYLRRLVAERHLTNVRFIGFVADEDLFSLFRAADVVVSPSVSELENTPISLLGAMSVGTPVIGTTVGGTGETVPDDHRRGIIVPPRDSPAIARAVTELLRAGKPDSEPAPPRFWENVARDYAMLFAALRPPGRGPAGPNVPTRSGSALDPRAHVDRDRT